MNIINVNVDFEKSRLKKDGIDLITGDYASTEIHFTFDREDGKKVFKMNSPSGKLVFNDYIIDNKVLLTAKDKDGNNVSIFNEPGKYTFDIALFLKDSRLTSVQGTIPVQQEAVVIGDEVVEQYLPLFDKLMQDIDNKIEETDNKIKEVDKKLDDVDTALDNVKEATNQTNNLDIDVSDKANKEVTITLTKKDNTKKSVKIKDGVSLQFMWQGTSLGIKADDIEEYVFVDLQGIQGVPGPQGEPFKIKKTYSSIEQMNADFDNMNYGDYVMIASDVEQEDNAKLYSRGETGWIFITDFSGAMGIRGETGLTPNIQIGSVSTLNPDENATVNRTGTNENPIFNFGIPQGKKGDKPVKGVDYFTPEDKKEMVDEVTQDSISAFNQNVDTKTDEFNNNVNEKITEFNTNAQNKTNEFNENKDKLQQELDRYKLLENALPHITGEGTSITLDNTAEAGMKLIPGPSEFNQERTNGYNLLNLENSTNLYQCTYDDIKKTYTSIPLTGDWKGISIYDNDKNVINVRNGDILYYSADARIVSGTYSNSLNLIRNSSDIPHTLTRIINPKLTNEFQRYVFKATYNESGIINGAFIQLWTGADNVLLEVKNVMVSIENVDYEPYTNGASPNPQFPQQIHTISGDNEVKVFNKNLLNIPNGTTTSNGITSTIENGKTIIKGTTTQNWFIIANNLNIPLSADTYIFSQTNVSLRYNLALKNSDGVRSTIYGDYKTSKIITLSEDVTLVTITSDNNEVNRSFDITDYIMLRSASIEDDTYEPPQEQKKQLNLPVENLYNSKENYSFITKKRSWIYVDGTEGANGSDVGTRTELKGKVKKGKIYTFKVGKLNTNSTSIQLIYGNEEIIKSFTASNISDGYTFTSTQDGVALLRIFSLENDNITISQIQLEPGSKANSYTPYGTTPIELGTMLNTDYENKFYKANNGSNMLNSYNIQETNNATISTTDRSFAFTITAAGSNDLFVATYSTILEPNTTYSIYCDLDDFLAQIYIYTDVLFGNALQKTVINNNSTHISYKFTTDSTGKALIGFYAIGLTQGTSKKFSNIVLYKGGKTLEKLQKFEPYNNGKWYLKKEIGKVVLDGSEEWNKNGYIYRMRINSDVRLAKCSHFINEPNWVQSLPNLHFTNRLGNYYNLEFKNESIETLEEWQNWLQEKYNSGNPVIVYYVLATPEYILVNDTLQEQLEDIYQTLTSYKGQTNITQINNDLPFNLKSSALKDLSNL